MAEAGGLASGAVASPAWLPLPWAGALVVCPLRLGRPLTEQGGQTGVRLGVSVSEHARVCKL